MKRLKTRVVRCFRIFCLLIGFAAALSAAEKPLIPDFTQGGKKDDSHDWLLGPTGARGWVCTSLAVCVLRHRGIEATLPLANHTPLSHLEKTR